MNKSSDFLHISPLRPWPPGWFVTSALNTSTTSVLLWQLSVGSAAVLVLFIPSSEAILCRFALICPSCLFSRPMWAAAWLQQNAQCHVLAQILMCPSVAVNRISCHYCESVHLRTDHTAWQHKKPSILFLRDSLCHPAHSSLLVSYEDGSQLAHGRSWLPLDLNQLVLTYGGKGREGGLEYNVIYWTQFYRSWVQLKIYL